jgi:prevent-host-death family protein
MPTLDRLHRVPASDVKKRGWRRVVREVQERGRLVVTNHAEPEAVVVSVKEYAALVAAADERETRAASELDALRQSFDDRLAVLRRPEAGAKLKAVMNGPARLRGKVKAGTGF